MKTQLCGTLFLAGLLSACAGSSEGDKITLSDGSTLVMVRNGDGTQDVRETNTGKSDRSTTTTTITNPEPEPTPTPGT